LNPPPSSSPSPLGWAKHSSVWLNLLNVEPRITRVAGSVVRRADARTRGHTGHRLGPRKPCAALKESEKGPYSRLTAVGGQKRVRGLTDCRSYSNKHAYIRTLGVGKTSASATRRFQRLSTSPDGTSWHLMHAHIHACIHTYIHTYTHTCMHPHIHTYIHTYMHRCCRSPSTFTRCVQNESTYMHAYIKEWERRNAPPQWRKE
jgi:hypothetical protein